MLYLKLGHWKNTVVTFTIKPFDFEFENKTELKQLGKKLKLNLENLVCAEQIHKDNIAVVTEKHKDSIIPDVDALITNKPNLPIGVRTADCVAIFLYDPVNSAIGLVHAGWRGTLSRIVQKTLKKMTGEFGTNAKNCFASLSPAIGICCYEVNNELANSFKKEFLHSTHLATQAFDSNLIQKTSDKKSKTDLKEINKIQLVNSGIKKSNITVSKYCTSCNKRLFFSYRRDGKNTGRHLSIISLLI